MPFNFYDDEDEFPPPQAPPPPPGGGQFPVINPGGGAPPPPSDAPGGGGGWGGGGGALNMPAYPRFSIPGAPAFTPPVFRRPTQQEAQNEPGYQFRSQAGADALERSAAAQGRLRTGGTLTDLLEYGQNFASSEYQRVFDRALGSYDRAYRGAHDAYAPQFAQWQVRADAEKQAQLAGYNTQLGYALQSSAPRPEPNLEDLLGPPPQPPGVYGGPSDYQAQDVYGQPPRGARAQGDPWTDAEYY